MSRQDMSDERLLTEAQCAHIRKLYAAFEQAQRQLNDFASYLMSEHGIDEPDQWQLSGDLSRFVRVEDADSAPRDT